MPNKLGHLTLLAVASLLDRGGRVAARFGGGVTEAELLRPVQRVAGEPG